MVMARPVRGLRAVRALRRRGSKLPNPVIWTFRPRLQFGGDQTLRAEQGIDHARRLRLGAAEQRRRARGPAAACSRGTPG